MFFKKEKIKEDDLEYKNPDEKNKEVDEVKNEKPQTIWYTLKFLLYSFIFVMLITLLVPLDEFLKLETRVKVIIANTSIFFLLASPLLLLKRGNFYFSIYGAMWILITYANMLVTKFRGTSLTKYDFLMIKQGLSMSSDFMNTYDFTKILVLVISLALFLYFAFKATKRYNKAKLENWIVASVMSIIMLNMSYKTFHDNDADKSGFVNYFISSMLSKEIREPKKYTKEEVLKIKDSLKNEKDTSLQTDELPNIVAIQLEAFFDPKDIDGLKLNKNPIPYFDKLRENFSSGYVNVPAYGGGTVLSEFEFLTTMDLDKFGKDTMPFNSFLKNKAVNSVPYMLKDLGYNNHFIHNYFGDFYNRNIVYKNLGFDTFTSKELIYYSAWDKDLIRASSDEALIREVCNLLETKDERSFILGVTAQLHSPYYSNYESHLNGIYASGNYTKKITGQINDYVNQINSIDKVIENLVTQIENINEPTILILYGDHQPKIDFSNTKDEDELYKTPYVVWDNIGLEKKDRDLELSDLLLSVLDTAKINIGIHSDLYKEYYGKSEYDSYKEIINYDITFGKNYLNNKKVYPSEMKMGYGEISVGNAVKTKEDEYIITGWNFTEYTKLICENKEYEVEYIGPAEIKIKTNDDLVNKKAYLEIGIGKNKNTPARSLEFKISK